MTLVVVLLIVGAPIALIAAWAFQVTPEGVVRTADREEPDGADPDAAPDAERPAHGGKPFTGDAAIVTMLALIAGLVAYPYVFGSEAPSPESGRAQTVGDTSVTQSLRLGEQSIAVLPFTYLAATDSADYFSLGMTDELLSRLAQIEDLSVIARTSVMQYRATDKTIPEIGRELGVGRVVEGSVQLAGRQVRIQVQLIDTRTGAHLWSEGFTRPYRNVLQLQSEVARQVAQALEVELLPAARQQLAAAPEVDSAAYALYLQGRHLRLQETGRSLTRAVRLLRRSVQMDPTFAPAWAMLSTSILLTPGFGGHHPDGLRVDSLARAAARRAVALDSTSADALVAMGILRLVLDRDFPAAGPWLKRAALVNSGLADAHREYGLYLSRMGQFEEAESHFRTATRLDPVALTPWLQRGLSEIWQGNVENARHHVEQALTLEPDYWGTRTLLGLTYLAEGEMEAALREIRRGAEVNPSPGSLAALGSAYAQAGRPDSARMVLERIYDRFGNIPNAAITEAIVHTALGETGQALDRLEEAGGVLSLKVGLEWTPLRGEPRYERLLEQMGLDDGSVRETMARLNAMDEPYQEAIP